jgi:hypothetical protein
MENNIGATKQENTKLNGSLGSGLGPAGQQILAKQGCDAAESSYSPADLHDLLEKVALNSDQEEARYLPRKDLKPQFGKAANVSVLSTSKLANQSAPRVSCFPFGTGR